MKTSTIMSGVRFAGCQSYGVRDPGLPGKVVREVQANAGILILKPCNASRSTMRDVSAQTISLKPNNNVRTSAPTFLT